MYLVELAEVAIGLVLAYLVLSLACMQVQEVIAGLFRLRASNLKDMLQEMLADPSRSDLILRSLPNWTQSLPVWLRWVSEKLWILAANFGASVRWLVASPRPQSASVVEQFYGHQLIKSLAQPGDKPSYIPAQTFAMVLFDVLMTAGTPTSTLRRPISMLKQALETLKPNAGPDPAALAALDALIVAAQEAQAEEEQRSLSGEKRNAFRTQYLRFLDDYKGLAPVVERAMAAIPKNSQDILEHVRDGAVSLAVTNPELTQALQTLIVHLDTSATTADEVLAEFRKKAVTWFDDTMDRASGWYKRRTQLWLFAIALILAIFLNMDTTQIAFRLWREPILRQALVAQAEQFKLPEPQSPITTTESISATALITTTIGNMGEIYRGLDQQLSRDLQLPVAWEVTSTLSAGAGMCYFVCQTPAVSETTQSVLGFGVLPLQDGKRPIVYLSNTPQDWGGWIRKVVGILITAAAASLGAPFWFDNLQKLINIRSAGLTPGENKPNPP